MADHDSQSDRLAHLEQKVKSEPENYRYLADLADAYADCGRWQDAIRAYEKAVALESEDAILYNDLAAAYEEIGDMAKAEENYQYALSLQPNLATAHFNLGLMLREQARLTEAIRHLEQCLEFSDDSYEIEESQVELGRLRTLHKKHPWARDVQSGHIGKFVATNAEWVSIADTAGRTEGEIIAGLLRAENIPAEVWMEGAGDAMGLSIGSLGKGRVMVPRAYLAEAKELLEAEVDYDAFFQSDDIDRNEPEDKGDGWWPTLAKGMLGLAAIALSPLGVVIALLFSRSLGRDARPFVICLHCEAELELDKSERAQGWYVCPECGRKVFN